MLPVYAHHLGSEGYGIIGMIDVVLSGVMLLIGYGITGAMTRIYFQKKTEIEKEIHISTNIFVMIFLTLLVCTPVLIFNKFFSYLAFGKYGLESFITISILTFILNITGSNASNFIVIKEKSLLFASISFLNLCLSLFFNIYFIVYLKMEVLGYLYAGLITGFASSFIFHFYALYHVGFRLNLDEAKEIMKFSIPLIPGYIAMFFQMNVGRIFLRSNLGLSQLGAYEMLFKFATLIGIFITEPFGKSWGVKRLEICETEEGPKQIGRMFTLQLALMCFFGLILSLEIPLFLKILTPQEFWLTGNIAYLAIMSRIVAASYMHFQFPLIYSKKTKKISMVHIAIAIISVPVSYILIKRYNIAGAINSSIAISIMQCFLVNYISKKEYYIPFEWKNIIFLITVTSIIFIFINKIDTHSGRISIMIENYALDPLKDFFLKIHLHTIKNGKIYSYIIGNLPIVFEGVIKALLSFVFIAFFPIIGIRPINFLKTLYKRKINNVLIEKTIK